MEGRTTQPALPSASHEKALLETITARSATVGVVGLGCVGLPLATEFALEGFRGWGFDGDRARVVQL